MKNLATSMMAIGLVLFAASSAFFAYHFVTLGNSTTADAVIMITSGALACFAVFMRSRAIAGIRVFEVTHKDKVEFQEMRRELGVRRILARLAGGFGSICFIGGVVTLLQNRADWHISLGMIAICGFLALCTSLLLKGFK